MEKNNDNKYSKKLILLGIQDQAYRSLKNPNTINIKTNAYIIDKKLDSLISNFGFPKISEVGKDAISSTMFIIIHSNWKYQKKYRKQIKSTFKNQELDAELYAMYIDRTCLVKNKKQIYGTQVVYDFKNDNNGIPISVKKKFYKMKNPKKVNKRREKIGITTTIEEYAKKMDVEYSSNPKK